MRKVLLKAADRAFRLIGMYPYEELYPYQAMRIGASGAEMLQFWRHSRPGTFKRYFSVNGDCYWLVIEIGPLAITWGRDD